MMNNELRPLIMLVDDDSVDLEAVSRAFSQRKLPYDILEMENAAEALDLLRSDQLDKEQRERLVVFLDINMPGMNGHQFLSNIRNDEKLKGTIIFVLTTSDQLSDKAKAYDKNVAGYFVKSNLNGLLDAMQHYLDHVEFPPVQ